MVKPHKNDPKEQSESAQMKKCRAKEQLKNFSRKFVKPLDKTLKIWYNIYTKERVAKATTEKYFQKNSKKVLTNSEIYGIIYM